VVIFIAIGSKLGLNSASDTDLFKRILYFIQRMIQSNGMKKIVYYTGSSK
jgi:hypothetical protein